MSVYAGPETTTNGLILSLDAGNLKSYPGSGSTWYDMSGNGYNGTLTNGPTYSSANGGSIVFDGVDDYVVSNYNFPTGDASKSFSVWFKVTSASARGWVISGGTNSNGQAFGLFLEGPSSPTGPGTLLFHGNGASADMIFNFKCSSGVWCNVTISYNGPVNYGYVNGVLDIQKTTTLNTSAGSLYLGARTPGNEYMGGSIAQASVYNRALSAAEISQNFNALRGRFGI